TCTLFDVTSFLCTIIDHLFQLGATSLRTRSFSNESALTWLVTLLTLSKSSCNTRESCSNMQAMSSNATRKNILSAISCILPIALSAMETILPWRQADNGGAGASEVTAETPERWVR
ncbi:hypothetical protein ACJX0J_037380, partial [Zea mays]